MKRTVFAFTSSVVLAGSFVIAQSQTPQTPRDTPQPAPSTPSATQPSSQQDRSESDQRLTGCLIQGSSPNVFILDNAHMSTDAKTAEGKKYVIVMADTSGLRDQLNRQVTITGASSGGSSASASSSSSSSTTTTTRPGQSGQAGQAGRTSDQPGQAGQAQAGQASQAGQAAGQSAAKMTSAQERELPRVMAKSIVRVADVCTTTE